MEHVVPNVELRRIEGRAACEKEGGCSAKEEVEGKERRETKDFENLNIANLRSHRIPRESYLFLDVTL